LGNPTLFKKGDFLDFFSTFSTLLHLPPLGFHDVGGFWDQTQDKCIGYQTLVTTLLDLIHSWLVLIRHYYFITCYRSSLLLAKSCEKLPSYGKIT
jgi:hypothetical protein